MSVNSSYHRQFKVINSAKIETAMNCKRIVFDSYKFFKQSATVAAIAKAREFESDDRSPLVSGSNPVAAAFALICKFEKEISPSTKSY